MRVITYETDRAEWDKSVLRKTCQSNEIDITVLGLGEEWTTTAQKTYGYLEYLSEIDSTELIMFCDNRDVSVHGKVEDFEEQIEKFNGKCVFGSELQCWPLLLLEKCFPWPKETKYLPECSRGLNCGVGIGYAGKMKELLDYSTRFYNIDMEQYLRDEYEIEAYDYDSGGFNDGGKMFDGDQLMIQLTYLETDLIELDYSRSIIFTYQNFDYPSLKWIIDYFEEKYGIVWPRNDLWNVEFQRNKGVYKSLYNLYTGEYFLVFHSVASSRNGHGMSNIKKLFNRNALLS